MYPRPTTPSFHPLLLQAICSTATPTRPSVLVEVNHNSASDLSPSELLHTLRHLTHASDLADRLEQTPPRVVQSGSSILHRADERADDPQVLEREEVRVRAKGDGAGGREGDGHDCGADAVTNILDRVWQIVSWAIRNMMDMDRDLPLYAWYAVTRTP
jgi:hypothetical protein